jgi:glycosyltransferase involved in cell wall biosynthesis
MRGGPSKAVVDMVHGLTRAGVEVHVATTDDDGLGHLDVPLGRPVVSDGVTFWYFRRDINLYTISWSLGHWLAKNIRHYDLVHVHALFRFVPTVAAWYAQRNGVPYCILPHGLLRAYGMQRRRRYLKRFSYYLIESKILNQASFVQCTSQEELIELRALGIRSPIHAIPLGLDIAALTNIGHFRGAFRRKYNLTSDKCLFLLLARLDPIKGLAFLLPAFARVKERSPDALLVLAGGGPPRYESHLRTMVAQLGIENSVIWAGFLEGTDKQAALADADILVLPSFSESFGVSAVESMACGLPVIVSDQVAIHQEVAEAKAGLVVPCQAEALAKAMSRLAGDPELRRELGANGCRLVQQRFSLDVATTRLIEIYAATIQRASQRSTASASRGS